MQIAAGPWILEATRTEAVKPVSCDEERVRPQPRPTIWTPPAAQGRGLLIDIIV